VSVAGFHYIRSQIEIIMIQNKRKVKTVRSSRAKRRGEAGRAVKKISPGSSGKPRRVKIHNKEVYELTVKEIDALMKKGEENLSQKEAERLRILAEAAENYEDTHEPLPIPSSLPDMIRMKMFQLRLKQHYTAKLLGVSEAKLSLIMSGKQKPDIYFVKALHEKLNLDANQILQAV
jgi:antitoxin component HigA of HigAB toxin-antitoxin module